MLDSEDASNVLVDAKRLNVMTDERTGGTQWPAWLCKTVAAVHASLDTADTAPALGTALSEELVSATGIEFAWIGTTTPDGIRVRSTPPEASPPQFISVEDPAETLTGTVESEGQASLSAPDEHADTKHICEQSTGDAVTVLALPLEDGNEAYGVLHLHTTAGVAEMPAVLPAVGRTVGRRLRAFEEAAQLRRERQRLEELRSLASHDLGNPLNIASGRVELAKQDTDSTHLESVETALERVDRLVDQGVELVEAGHQPEDVEQISLAALAEDCWTDVGHERGTLTVEDATLVGERERVRHLVDELIENAFDYSEGAVTVDIGPLSAVQGFYVADDGPGIPNDERPYVLDTGYTTAEGRDGIGLSLVTEIAGAHGWDVSLENGDSGGTRVELVTSRW